MKRFLFFLCMPALANARIGETEKELIARYGEPVDRMGPDSLIFRKGPLKIDATLWNGKCHKILFFPSRDFDSAAKLTKDQTDKLLAANSGGSRWLPLKPPFLKSEDGKRFAESDPDRVYIETAEYRAHCEAARKAAAEEKRKADDLDGF